MKKTKQDKLVQKIKDLVKKISSMMNSDDEVNVYYLPDFLHNIDKIVSLKRKLAKVLTRQGMSEKEIIQFYKDNFNEGEK